VELEIMAGGSATPEKWSECQKASASERHGTRRGRSQQLLLSDFEIRTMLRADPIEGLQGATAILLHWENSWEISRIAILSKIAKSRYRCIGPRAGNLDFEIEMYHKGIETVRGSGRHNDFATTAIIG